MLRAVYYSRQFKKDIKLAQKRRKDIDKLKSVITHLVEGVSLPDKHRDHPLSGDFAGYRECHVESDWLVIYKLDSSNIQFIRTGTHSDLF